MRLVILLTIVVAIQVECQFWPSPKEFLNNFSWFRQPKMNSDTDATAARTSALTTDQQTTIGIPTILSGRKSTNTTANVATTTAITKRTTPKNKPKQPVTTTLNDIQTMPTVTGAVTKKIISQPTTTTTFITTTDRFTDMTATTEDESVTLESRDNPRVHQYFPNKREKPQVKIAANISQNLLPLPAGAGAALVKPTKYHYYPHNQHIYLLPECAIQQVCNAVYIRLNWTQPLCACPSRYRDPCSASLNSDDLHTTELVTDPSAKRALTLVKTCEPTADMRLCRTPRDWSLLALQNIRTGKSHYLVICRCPDSSILEGPMSHDQPTYASVPGIRVYGMMCVNDNRRGRPLRMERSVPEQPAFPWDKVTELANTADWD